MFDLIIGFIQAYTDSIEPVHVAQAYYAQAEPSVQDILASVSREKDFDVTILTNVVSTETGGTFDCSLVGKDGELGCLQIIPKFHPGVDPLDLRQAASYFIDEYRAGRGWQWTGCSCTKSARLTVPDLPKGDAASFKPNATMQEGRVVILDYNGERHLAAYKIASDGLKLTLEGNYEPCMIKDRTIPWNELKTHLIGFYTPASLAVETEEDP